MKVKSIKRDTLLVIIAVLTLTLVCLRTSYAAFVSIQTESELQSISSGTLDVVIDNASTAMSNANLFPTPNNELPTASNSTVPNAHSYSRLLLNNDGTLNATFSVTVSYDNLPVGKTVDDLVSFNYLKIGIFDVDENEWIDFGNGTYNTVISNLTPSEENVYPILRDEVPATDTREFRVYVWLTEDIPETEIGKIVYLKLNVKSIVNTGR
jgi:hypothetical protein